jgi:hypothetical protein
MVKLYRKCLFFVLLQFSSLYSFSQNFGDEWIDFNQTYYKLKVAKEGLYKISYELLKNGQVDEKFLRSNANLQLWHRGKQIPISIQAKGDSLRAGNYIVFYGTKNDGEQDEQLYYPKTNLYNQYTNLFSDTTAYFLTVSEKSPWLRIDTLGYQKNTNGSDYGIAEYLKTYFDAYWTVGYESEDPILTFFSPCEGWRGNGFYKSIENVPVKNYVYSDSVVFELYLMAWDRVQFSPKIDLLPNSGFDTLHFPSYADTVNTPFGGVKLRYALPNVDLNRYISGENVRLEISFEKGVLLSYVRLLYPQKANYEPSGQSFFYTSSQVVQSPILPKVARPSYFAMVNDRYKATWLKPLFSNDTSFLPSLPSGSKVFYSHSFDSLKAISPVVFSQYTATDSNYLIVTHEKLFSSATEYANYRKSVAGGGYDVLLADIHRLHDQFAYGERSPLSIRRLLNRLKSMRAGAPDHLFIIGLGIAMENTQANRTNPLRDSHLADLVLPAGTPGGDHVFSWGLDGTSATNAMYGIGKHYPAVSTGRLSAKTNQQVLDYLDKVKSHEALPAEAAWRRNVLQISGGYQTSASNETNNQTIRLFRAYMDGFTNIIKQPYLGANVTNYSRTNGGESTALIDVSAEVNKGVSLITFLGHSSANTTDVTIGYVSDNYNTNGYANQGKYPMLFLNGCEIGNTFFDFGDKTGYSNFLLDWILTPKRGAILGLSNSSTGFSQYLKLNIENTYITSFLDSANFNKSVGEQVKLGHKRFLDTYTNPTKPDLFSNSMLQNSNLQGDPAIHLFNTPKADYEVLCDRVALKSFSNKKITSQSDSFELLIPIRNLGMYTRQNFNITVRRSYLNNTKSIPYPPQLFAPVRELDTLRYKIKGALPEASGANLFEIAIDPDNQVPELVKSNNNCAFTAYLPGNAIATLYPKKYSIVNKPSVTFIAQSYTIGTAEREFYIELDTNFRFNSPFKKSATVRAFNLPQWTFSSLLPIDSLVYYWRIRYVQPLPSEDTAYSYSSFLYIGNSPEGWSQSEYPQFFENEARAIKLDSNTGIWRFEKISAPLKMGSRGIGSASGSDIELAKRTAYMTFKDVPLIYENISNNSSICEHNGLYLITINPQDMGLRWVTPNLAPDERSVLYMCNPYFSFLVTRFLNIPGSPYAFNPNKVYEVLKERVKEGEIVALMNIGRANFPWPDSLNQVLKTLYGASNSLDTLKDGYPYLLVGRKGIGKIVEKIPTSANPYQEVLSLDTLLYSLGNGGYVSSTIIGPAAQWGNFFRSYRKEAIDSVRFDILKIDSTGRESLALANVQEDNFSLTNQINASQFPFLRLNAYMESKTLSAPQLRKWQVIYRPVPEGTLLINEKSAAEYAAFSKQEGDTTQNLTFRFQNISSEAFLPNLLVRYRIVNANKILTYYDTLKTALAPDSIWNSTFKTNTLGLVGSNTLEIFFNPSPGQKETMLDNNRYTVPFEVVQDKTQPILEVAFDGMRIMNGDIVSPSPTISVAINDENKFLIRKDTTGIRVELQRPCAQANCPFERINLGGHEVTLFPAGPNNKFELRYKPEKLPDGVYTLRVQAKDVSGNLSGVKPYTIQFEVVNEVAITNFLPYPNPFSSKMWFVYTLTGDMPDQLRIQIMTVTGKVVRQIFMDELGPLRIGTHRTDYVWEGTDDYGDQLANGLYLYKVSARKGGEDLKRRNTVADNLFKNGYGKLYILR